MSWADVGRPAFLEFESRFRIELVRVMRVDRKPPMRAAALLVLVAYEAIGRLIRNQAGKGKDVGADVFAQQLAERRGVPRQVGKVLCSALRDGIAHSYRTHRIVVGAREVRPMLTWDTGPHLQIVGVRSVSLHDEIVPAPADGPLGLCVVVKELWNDLDSYLRDLRASLDADSEMSETIQRRAAALMKAEEGKLAPEGSALAAWRQFIRENRYTS